MSRYMSQVYQMNKMSNSIAIVFFSLALAACGGGSDGSSSTDKVQDNNGNVQDKVDPVEKCNDSTTDSSDLDNDGTVDACDDDIDGDGVINEDDAKPEDAAIVGISTTSYQGAVNAMSNFYFNAQNQMVASEYISSSNPEQANSSERLTYDDKGRLIRLEATRGNNNQRNEVELWVYNQQDQLTAYKRDAHADGEFEKSVTYQYNDNGDIVKIVEVDTSSDNMFDNLSWNYIYNSFNQLVTVTTDETNDGSIDRIKELAYDTNDYLVESKLYFMEGADKNLIRTIKYSYDGQGNVLKTDIDYTDGEKDVVTYTYNDNGDIIHKVDNSIDSKLTYNTDNLATKRTTEFDSYSSNVQDTTHIAEYDTAGYLTKVTEDVSQDNTTDKQIIYSYQGIVPIRFNIAPFVNVGEATYRAPTADSIYKISSSFDADTVKDRCYEGLNVTMC